MYSVFRFQIVCRRPNREGAFGISSKTASAIDDALFIMFTLTASVLEGTRKRQVRHMKT